MGLRYTTYRSLHELKKKIGILKKRHPINPLLRQFVSKDNWLRDTPLFVISEREEIDFNKIPNQELKNSVAQILSGNFLFFNFEWKFLGQEYDWITNPESDYQYDIGKHWSEISDFSETTGDIKYVWEKSRFTYLLTVIRNDFHNSEDHSEFVFSEIEKWIDSNPVNQGPNWYCSQEISLRIFNWCYALYFYKNSLALSEDLWNKIQNVIYWSLHHVYHNINFSRIAVRNNHAITETLFLALSNMLFPYIPETEKWAKRGRIWFEEEIAYQIYEDGTFLQFSMNYHRVVIQLLSFALSISERNKQPFSEETKNKAYKSLDFLYQCMQHENGFLPNYGANDGALFFPLSDMNYRDFRPQLNTLHKLLVGVYLYEDKVFKEDGLWMGVEDVILPRLYHRLEEKQGVLEFKFGGYYLIREYNTFTFIKCGVYKDRPSHADNLHMDVWYKGRNILCDGGSFKYNTEKAIVKYFAGTESHNTVMLDDFDQMLKGEHFIWIDWSQAINATINETETEYVFSGEVKCFSYLNKKIIHKRTVTKIKDKLEWLIKDEIRHKPFELKLRQLWHTTDDSVNFHSEGALEVVCQGWCSQYYGQCETTKQIEYTTTSGVVETRIKIL